MRKDFENLIKRTSADTSASISLIEAYDQYERGERSLEYLTQMCGIVSYQTEVTADFACQLLNDLRKKACE